MNYGKKNSGIKTVKDALAYGLSMLLQNHIATPHLDSEVLLASSLRKTKEFLYTHFEYCLSQAELKRFTKMIQRRANHEPIAYINKKKEFFGYEFYVDKRVLIPRPETESIVEKALQIIQSCQTVFRGQKITLIDVGTGSGCIIVSLILEIKKKYGRFDFCSFFATDDSSSALSVASRNAKSHGVEKSILFSKSDLLTSLKDKIVQSAKDGSVIIITANLPYITPALYRTLVQDIRFYEPKKALLTPNDSGDYFYRKLDKQVAGLKTGSKVSLFKLYELL